MPVKFTEAEIQRVPEKLRPLMQHYPRTFDQLLGNYDAPRLTEPLNTIDVYFDEELFPALSIDAKGVIAHEATETPVTLMVMANDQCAYVQIGEQILLNRLSRDFLSIFEVKA